MAHSQFFTLLFKQHKEFPILKGRRIVTDIFGWEQGYSKKSEV